MSTWKITSHYNENTAAWAIDFSRPNGQTDAHRRIEGKGETPAEVTEMFNRFSGWTLTRPIIAGNHRQEVTR